MKNGEFVKISEIFSKRPKTAEIRGWVHRKREQKEMIFVLLRDSSGVIQCTFRKGDLPEDVFRLAESLTIESSVKIKGDVKEDKRAPGGFEVLGRNLEVVGLAETFPIGKDLSEEFLLDVRHLWIRSQKLTNVLKIRSKVFEAIHEYFRKNGYHEFHSPLILSTACEGGSTLFEIKYFGEKLHLSQSWQLHAETALAALEKIYTVTPAFRSEKSRTNRHLTEYWTAEVEEAWVGFDEMTKVAEGLLSHICGKVAKECGKELGVLGRKPESLLKIKSPFPRINYTEALEILKNDGMEVKWGKDLRTEEERQLMKHYDRPLIITNYPKEVKAFYMKEDASNPKTVLGFDVLAPETGDEIIGGSERSTDIEYLKKRLKESGGNPKDYEFYLDTRKYGSVPHAGFGLGIERVIMWICGLEHIRDAIPFPRTAKRYRP